MIPILDLKPGIDAQWEQIHDAVTRVLQSGRFILGPEVSAFEEETANYLGAKHAIALNSGTDALVIGLRALNVGPGDEVITTPFTFVGTAEAIALVGATPVLVDIEPDTFNLDPSLIEAAITARTRAIAPVHLFGHAAEMDAIQAIAQRHNLPILEDAAQAFGADYRNKKAGAIGQIGAFSFFPTKNLGAFGDAGLIATNDDSLAELCRMLRVHGSRERYKHELVGYNSRMDELQAAILRIRLQMAESNNAARRDVADRYANLLADVDGLALPSHREHVTPIYHQYTVRITTGNRDAVHRRLGELGVGAMIYYPIPVHRLEAFPQLHHLSLPESELAAEQVISLPIWPELDAPTQQRVADALKQALAEA